MMEYKYVNDTEAALKRIKAECRMKKCKPSFKAKTARYDDEMMEGTIKQVEFLLHHHEQSLERYRNYSCIAKADSEIEVTVFEYGGVWVYMDIKTTRKEEDEEE